ncbi:transposable element Tc1 transposase [Trichonephila clavipes]|nr:transposable element Tc1 transposase [Trichonephila clavipes]
MPPQRNKEKFQQLKNFERGRIIGLQEGVFSYLTIGPRVQRNNSTVIRLWKQWTDEHQTTQKIGRRRWKVTSARKDHDVCIRVRRYAGERRLPECVIERHSGLTPGVKPAYLLDMSPIEHVWTMVGRRLARDPRPPNTDFGHLILFF